MEEEFNKLIKTMNDCKSRLTKFDAASLNYEDKALFYKTKKGLIEIMFDRENPKFINGIIKNLTKNYNYESYLDNKHNFIINFMRILAENKSLQSNTEASELTLVYFDVLRRYGKEYADKSFSKVLRSRNVDYDWEGFNSEKHLDTYLTNKLTELEHSNDCVEFNEGRKTYKCIKSCIPQKLAAGDYFDVIFINSQEKKIIAYQIKVMLTTRRISSSKATKKSITRDRGNNSKVVSKKMGESYDMLSETLPEELQDYEIEPVLITTGYLSGPAKKDFDNIGIGIKIIDKKKCYEKLWTDNFIRFIDDFEIEPLFPTFSLSQKELKTFKLRIDRLGIIKKKKNRLLQSSK